MIDNNGNDLSIIDVVGIACKRDWQIQTGEFTQFDPNSKSALALSFSLRDGPIGNIFTFSAEILMLEGEKMSRFSVGIPNIELR